MALTINIKHATRKGRTRLCDTCSYFRIAKGEAESAEFCYCTILERPIFTKIVECNCYQKIGTQSTWDMQKQAWILETTGKQIGFVKPDIWHKKHGKDNALEGVDTDKYEKGDKS